MKTFEEISLELKTVLNQDRYAHTMGVAYTATSLAMRYEKDIEKAMFAGLLHDCAKCYSNQEKFAKVKSYQIELSKIEVENPGLIHAKLGAEVARDLYGVTDLEILNSIRYHTTGRPAMNWLEQIIFIADYIEPLRKVAPNLKTIRKESFLDLNKATTLILENILSYLHTRNNPIDTMTQKTYDYYSKITTI